MNKIQFSHANGFPAKSYDCLFKHLSEYEINHVNCFGVDENYLITNDWNPLIKQLVDSIRKFADEPIIAVGHSLGGVLTFFAAQRHPELFEKIIFLDPPFFNFVKRNILYWAHRTDTIDRFPSPAKLAKYRKRNFVSPDDATQYFGQKAFFRNFDNECFSAYIEHGIQPIDQKYTLSIPAQLEYQIFRTIPHRYGNRKLRMPSYFVHSSKFEVISPSDFRSIKRNFSNTEFISFDGGHMFPLEKPKETAELIKQLIQGF